MSDQEKIQAVMNQTGADRETAEAALNTSDGNIETAVRIISAFTLKAEARKPGMAGGTATGGGGAGETGPAATEHAAASEEKTEQAESEQGTGSWQAGQEQDEKKTPRAQDIIDAIKEIWRTGNASRLDIEKNDRVILSVSLTLGTIGLVIAPVAAIIGLGAALITEYTVKITLNNGNVINVNEFAVTHKHTREDI